MTQSVSVVSAHVPPGHDSSTVDWESLARVGGTLVLLMAVGRLEQVCAALLAAGRAADTPMAVVEDGTLPTQRVSLSTLGAAVADFARVKAPAIVVIGDVVGLAR